MSALPAEREWLAGIRPRKRLGQNFLLDPRIPQEIVRRASWPPGAPVLEIGPGGGALTAELLAAGHRVSAVEIDPALAELLRRRFAAELQSGSFEVTCGDILETGLPSAGPDGGRWLAGNLPYGLTTPILLRSMRARAHLAGAVFMVQREYGERVLAAAGEKAYGSLSVWVAAHALTRSLLRVGRSAFWPRPGVESIVIEFLFPDPPPFDGNRPLLERLLRSAFGQRRKTLENALAHGFDLPKTRVRQLCQDAGVDPTVRAETLPLARFAALTAVWEEPAVADPRNAEAGEGAET